MSDQEKVLGSAEAGQPQETPSDEGQETSQPEYLTRDEAERLAREAEERAFRRSQSLYDKGNQRVRERLDALDNYFDSQAEMGNEVPDDVKARMRQKEEEAARKEAASETGPAQTQPAQAGAGAPDPKDAPDPTTQAAWQMMKDAGVWIEDSDPETETLDMSSEGNFLRSMSKAIEAKQARLGGQQEEKPQAEPTGPTRTPTSAGVTGSHSVQTYAEQGIDAAWDDFRKQK